MTDVDREEYYRLEQSVNDEYERHLEIMRVIEDDQLPDVMKEVHNQLAECTDNVTDQGKFVIIELISHTNNRDAKEAALNDAFTFSPQNRVQYHMRDLDKFKVPNSYYDCVMSYDVEPQIAETKQISFPKCMYQDLPEVRDKFLVYAVPKDSVYLGTLEAIEEYKKTRTYRIKWLFCSKYGQIRILTGVMAVVVIVVLILGAISDE